MLKQAEASRAISAQRIVKRCKTESYKNLYKGVFLMPYGPDPNAVYPNEAIKSVCFIKNVITRPSIFVGAYTYYDDNTGPEQFERHVTHHYDFLGDKLIIGKFCAIAKGIEFVMNGANHRMNSVTTYPFNIMGGGWEKSAPVLEDDLDKIKTVI